MLHVLHDYPLQPLNTFGMKVAAAHYSILEHEADLASLNSYPEKDSGILVLGGGSNLLFTKNLSCWVLHNKIRGIEKIKEEDTQVWLRAGAGEPWHEFVLYCVQHHYYGTENLSLIPGTVGAAPIQNIGAYGAELKDIVTSVRCWHLEEQSFKEYSNEDCRFAYRDSIFKQELKDKVIITSVTFRLDKIPRLNTSYGTIAQELEGMGVSEVTLRNVSDAIIRIRKARLPDPAVLGNAGSFFKNPEVPLPAFEQLQLAYPDIPGYVVKDTRIKIPAAWLIEQCGWKGYRKDHYGVHQHQALVLVNYGGAEGNDIARLSEAIMLSVKERFSIDLEREVRIL